MAPRPRTDDRRGLSRAIERVRPGDDLEALRQVLVGPEQSRIERIECAITPAAIGRVLPETVVAASGTRGDELATALARPVERALRDVAKHDPKWLGEILAPSIGTAVRTAVAEVIAAVLERINQMLERALSLRSIQWRLEARRTNKSLAEVALAHTVLYRVEWVVLLQTETSLVLEQASLPEVTTRVPDQLAAMLQAIGSFVSEAFYASTPGGELGTLEIGDLTVWLERDAAFTLAAAIRGVPPVQLRERLRTALAEARTLHPEDLSVQIVDTARFTDTQPLLAECLQQQLHPIPRRAQRILAIAGIAALLGTGYAVARSIDASRTRTALARQDAALRVAYKDTLQATPGIVVTSVDRVGRLGLYRIEGLRDPRAAEPWLLLARAGLPPPALALTPYDSADPRLGSPYAAAGAAIRALEQIEFRYPNAMAAIDANDPDIRRAARFIEVAERAAAHAGAGLCVEVIGESSAGGSRALNERLRAQRAENVIEALAAAGVRRGILGSRVEDRPTATGDHRRVSLRAVLRPDPQTPGCAG